MRPVRTVAKVMAGFMCPPDEGPAARMKRLKIATWTNPTALLTGWKSPCMQVIVARIGTYMRQAVAMPSITAARHTWQYVEKRSEIYRLDLKEPEVKQSQKLLACLPGMTSCMYSLVTPDVLTAGKCATLRNMWCTWMI